MRRQQPTQHNPVNLQTFRQTYELLMDGVQGRSRYHSHTENQSVFQQSRIHAPLPLDGRRKLPELKLRDTSANKQTQLTSPTSKSPQLSLPQQPVVQKSPLQGALKLDPKVKRALSIQCKGNFIQFLVVQRAGRVSHIYEFIEMGDYHMFERFKDMYHHQLFDVQRAKQGPKMDKRKISYLKLEEENPEDLKSQVRSVLTKHKNKNDRGLTPLDDFIRNVHESKAPRFPKLHHDQSFTSNIASFDI